MGDGMIQTGNVHGRRWAFVAGLAMVAVLVAAPRLKLPADGIAQEQGNDEWISLAAAANESDNESANQPDNGTNSETNSESDNESANESDSEAETDAGSPDETFNESVNDTGNVSADCSADWQGCLETKCCVNKAFRCYKKNDHWAQCRTQCTPGIDPHDKAHIQNPQPWSCDDWDRTPNKCAGRWEGCKHTKCCSDPKQRCFKKNDHWAQCRHSCKPGIDEHDRKMGKHVGEWSCEKFDETPDPEKCSADVHENCWKTRCCSNSNSTCYKKDAGWAACNATCAEAIWDKDPKEHQRKWQCDLV